jgi:2-polyprenyl-6-methoxyphenol hydroxylase-like FAD-dependent oxidoreductase
LVQRYVPRFSGTMLGISHWFLAYAGNRSIGIFFQMKGGEIARVITLNENKNPVSEPHRQEPLTPHAIEKNSRDAAKQDFKIENASWVSRHRGSMRVGPVFLAGDAAHIIARQKR